MQKQRKRRKRKKKFNNKNNNPQEIKIGFLNMQGGRTQRKWEEITMDSRISEINVMCVTETHLKDGEQIPDQEDWSWEGVNRKGKEKKGGGIGMLIQMENTTEVIKKCEEHMWCKVNIGEDLYIVGTVYMATGNSRETEIWNEKISECIHKDIWEINKKMNGNAPIIIGGDFNAHIIEFGGREDKNGTLIKQMCEMNGLNMGNLLPECEGKITWQRGSQRTTIDYVLLNDIATRMVKKISIDEDGLWSVGSDHNRILVTFNTCTQKEQEKKNTGEEVERELWSLEEGNLEKFKIKMESYAQENKGKATYEQLVKVISEIASQTVERKKVGGKKGLFKPKKWWDQEVKDAIKIRKQLCKSHRKALKEGNTSEEVNEKWETYSKQKEITKQLIAKKIREMNKKIETEIKNAGRGAGKKFWSYIKGKKKKEKTCPIRLKNKQGVYLTGTREIEQCIIEHMTKEQNKLTKEEERLENIPRKDGKMTEEQGNQTKNLQCTNLQRTMETKEADQNLKREISEEELGKAIKKMKKGKAPGLDNIPNEMIQALGEKTRQTLLKVFNDILLRDDIPKDWKQIRIRLLHKGKGKPTDDLNSYRPIAVANSLYKIYMSVLKNRLDTHLEKHNCIGETQNGFRKERQIGDNLFTISQIIEIARKKGNKLVMAFLDITKAYDCVNRTQLWDEIRKKGIDDCFIKHLEKIYEESTYIFQFQDTLTKPWTSKIGLKQGCPMSTTLFLIYLDNLSKRLLASGKGYKIPIVENERIVNTNEVKVPAVLQADDIVLISEEEELQTLLDNCTDFGNEFNVEFGEEKCKIMFFSEEENIVKPQYKLQGKTLKEANSYKYLGIHISNGTNYLQVMQEALVKKANKFKGAICHTATFAYNKYSVGRTIWKAVAVPSLTYGNEVITVDKQTRNHLERTQREVGRRLLGANYITPNLAIQGEMGWSTMEAREAKSKIKFKGRLVFMKEERYPKLIYNYLRFSGIQTDWTRRLKQLDKCYGKETKRSTNTNFKNWKEETEKDVNRNQELKWNAEKKKKASMSNYMLKEKPSKENFYEDSKGSALLFQARVGALATEVRLMEIYNNDDNECKLCKNQEAEDLDHIFIKCKALEKNHWVLKLRKTNITTKEALGLEKKENGWDINNTKNILKFWNELHEKANNNENGDIEND